MSLWSSELCQSPVGDLAAFSASGEAADRRWYAVFTVPQNERSAARHLHLRDVETFIPTFEEARIWKNRQRVKIVVPLFPSYIFVRINRKERGKILQSPGVLRIIGNSREALPLMDSEIEFLRMGFTRKTIEPYLELAVGQKVRIKSGPMHGLEGILVRKNNGFRFVLRVSLINQHAAIEIDAGDLEPSSN